MRPSLVPIALLLAGAALLPACGDCTRCEKEQDRVLTQMGAPAATESRRDGHFVTETWFYWDEQRPVVFLWDDRECSCSVSEYDLSDQTGKPVLHFETANRLPRQPLGPH